MMATLDVREMVHGPPASSSKKRKGARVDQGLTQRSSHACQRCKTKKLRCRYDYGEVRKCLPCMRADTDCVFDQTPDGVPRGAAYIASLEARVNFLESELAGDRRERQPIGYNHDGDAATDALGDYSQRTGDPCPTALIPSVSFEDLTIFNIGSSGFAAAKARFCAEGLPDLPTPETAGQYLEAAYQYTQARYCIVDWSQLRRWNDEHDSICRRPSFTSAEETKAAYFLWMTYAIGAQLQAKPDAPASAYYTRALQHVHAVLDSQDTTTVQALLMMVQYGYRALSGPSQYSIVGAATRLCVELGLHRKSSTITQLDSFTLELQKRFFWCAYGYDRLVSLTLGLPFGINDLDIDVHLPLNIDLDATDETTLARLQAEQGGCESRSMELTSMSSCLHLLQMYRLRSRIKTYFYGPHAQAPSKFDILHLMDELEEWRRKTPTKKTSFVPPIHPRMSDNDLHVAYLQAALFLCSPVLALPAVEQELLNQCATLSTRGCETSLSLCLSPTYAATNIQAYICFVFGITLLRCLVIQPQTLPMSQTTRVISNCSSALAIYARALGSLSVGASCLKVWQSVCDRYFGVVEGATTTSYAALGSLLQHLSSCGPEKVTEFVSLPQTSQTMLLQDPVTQASAAYASPSSAGLDLTLNEPIDSYLNTTPHTLMSLVDPFSWYASFDTAAGALEDSLPMN